ncbi:Protein phosphatase 2C domain containing protein [Elaphomyces granulatus]
MEDAHATVLDLQAKYLDKSGKPTSSDQRLSFFGVYDGHGGDRVALFAGENVHRIIAKQESFAKGNMEQALKDGFLATDRAILEDPKYEEEVSGCTAAVSIISKDKIWVANAGDSRLVLGVKGRAKPLSFDHKPQNEGERARIRAAGGFVDFGRVNGNLALSRAIGDFEFKKSAELSPEQQIVTAFPDVTVHEITEDDEFLVIACDGIWDCRSSQSVVEFVRRGIVAKQELYQICENMMNNCLSSNCETTGGNNGTIKSQRGLLTATALALRQTEFRAPGARHRFDDSPDDYDLEIENRRGFSVRSGRIIFLGDGTEALAENDEDLFDRDDETKDVANEVRKRSADPSDEQAREEREGTPGPQLTRQISPQTTDFSFLGTRDSTSPSSTTK